MNELVQTILFHIRSELAPVRQTRCTPTADAHLPLVHNYCLSATVRAPSAISCTDVIGLVMLVPDENSPGRSLYPEQNDRLADATRWCLLMIFESQ